MASRPVYRQVEGLHLSYFYSDQNIRAALAYKPRPQDIFVVSYPKCGITRLQYLVYNIFSGGTPPESAEEFCSSTPFLEVTEIERIKGMPRPGTIRTHLPFRKQPYSKRAKYIYIARNPYDCCVSCYHHARAFPVYYFEDGTFDQFFDVFVEGTGEYGDYFDHLLSWYERRHDPNVFFLTYEGLKRDTESWVLKMADFLGKEYGDKLRADSTLLGRIVEVSSIGNMKKVFNEACKRDLAHVSPAWGHAQGSLKDESVEAALKKPMTGDFVRKGVVGDWRNHFSAEQIERMKERIATKTAGSDVMQLWRDCELP